MDENEVDIRVFGANITSYLASGTPVTLMQNGQTVGYFIPAQRHDAADLAALQKAGEEFDQALGWTEIDIEEAVAEIDTLRQNARQRTRPAA